MLKTTRIDLKRSGLPGRLPSDYLYGKPELRPFYTFTPDIQGFSDLLKTSPYAGMDRAVLSDTLNAQATSVNNSSEASFRNIDLLRQKTAFTVTTGHQLCLFTGPLYFIYKIFSTIRLAEELTKEFPDRQFVPVYWMASEDHDFEEISGFTVNGRSFKWNSRQTGAVGDFDPRELKTQMASVREVLGISANADQLFRLFENAYLKHTTLAAATRYLVNELFGAYGLVVLDGNDRAFKKQFIPWFKKDLFGQKPFHLVQQSVKDLETLGYHSQVNPRPINCFYMEKGLRVRIENDGDQFRLTNTDRRLTKEELLDLMENEPEKLSPNVVLRPLYQQVILPNLAYLGGPGELADWLEFKAMFDGLGVTLPLLLPRNFMLVVDKPTQQKMTRLGFTPSDLFRPEAELVKDYMKNSGQVFDLVTETAQAKQFYAALMARSAAADPTLEKHVAAELARVEKKLKGIGEKVNRALKRKADTELSRIRQIKEQLFPNGVPQERIENFAALWLNLGPEIFEILYRSIVPLDFSVKLLTEE